MTPPEDISVENIAEKLSVFLNELVAYIGKDSSNSHKIVELSYSPNFRITIFDYRIDGIHVFYIYTYKNVDGSIKKQVHICTCHDEFSAMASYYLDINLLSYNLEIIKDFVYDWYSNKIKCQAEKFNKKREELESRINLMY